MVPKMGELLIMVTPGVVRGHGSPARNLFIVVGGAASTGLLCIKLVCSSTAAHLHNVSLLRLHRAPFR